MKTKHRTESDLRHHQNDSDSAPDTDPKDGGYSSVPPDTLGEGNSDGEHP